MLYSTVVACHPNPVYIDIAPETQHLKHTNETDIRKATRDAAAAPATQSTNRARLRVDFDKICAQCTQHNIHSIFSVYGSLAPLRCVCGFFCCVCAFACGNSNQAKWHTTHIFYTHHLHTLICISQTFPQFVRVMQIHTNVHAYPKYMRSNNNATTAMTGLLETPQQAVQTFVKDARMYTECWGR